jgi:crotonobetainyl-CoA:carnitine CoA-transferase CaiB-like acyl-CoA transferase
MDLRNSMRDSMREILAATGSPEGEGVRFSGADPVFPTPYLIGTAGAAALGALGLAVSRLWQLRGGRAQRVSIDARAAAASLRSAHYLRIDGQAPKGPWDPYSGFYPVKDGRWISIHCNFSNHREAALKVLGNPPDRAAAEQVSAAWDGLALENAIHEARGCAGLARSAAEWATHPHSSAVAAQPLLEITRIGEAPPQPLPAAARPLSGVRVLDLTRVLAGPTCARSLAEHGADVLKITSPHLPDSGLVEWDTGIGKRAAHLDLREPSGAENLRALLREADVFSQSYRPGALAAKGFSPEEAARLRPGIVYVTLSAWGTQGPWKDRRGFDSIVQTVSGMALAQGGGSSATSKPKLLPVSAIDYVAGYLMATGALAALARRAEEGGSWLVRVSLARTGKWIVDRGYEAALAGVPADLPEHELATLMEERDTSLGRIRHLKPVLGLSETPPFWERPPVALGTHPAAWSPGKPGTDHGLNKKTTVPEENRGPSPL